MCACVRTMSANKRERRRAAGTPPQMPRAKISRPAGYGIHRVKVGRQMMYVIMCMYVDMTTPALVWGTGLPSQTTDGKAAQGFGLDRDATYRPGERSNAPLHGNL